MNIGAKVVSSLKWMALFRFSGQMINWAITIVVIRLLTPEDYGLMSQAMIIIGLLALINEMGMSAALIQKKEFDRTIASQVFAAALSINSLIFILVLLIAPFVAAFFNEPQLTHIIYLLGAGFLFQSFSLVPSAVLSRDMAFKKKAGVDLATMLVSSLSTLALALNEFGVWALITGHLAGIFVRVLGINLVAKYWVLPKFSMTGMRSTLTFGGTITADRVLWYLYSQADMIIVGKMLGKELLGFYSVSMQLATLPMQKISGMMNEVGFAAFSRVQDDVEQFRAHFIKAARILCVFAFPVFWGISAVTPEIVMTFLGEKWQPAIFPMQLLSLIIPFRMLSTIASPALAGKGRPDISLKNLIIACCIMPAAFFVGVQWGLTGVALAWVIAYPITFAIMQYRALQAISVPLGEYVKEVSKPIIPAACMFAAVYFARIGLADVLPEGILSFIVFVAIGGLVFLTLMFVMQKALLKEVLSMVKK